MATLARYLLRQQFDESQIAVREVPHDQLATIGFGFCSKHGLRERSRKFFSRLLELLAQGFDLIKGLANLLGQLPAMRRKLNGGITERGEVAAGGGDGALAADEPNAPSLPGLFRLAEQDAAELFGGPD